MTKREELREAIWNTISPRSAIAEVLADQIMSLLPQYCWLKDEERYDRFVCMMIDKGYSIEEVHHNSNLVGWRPVLPFEEVK